MMSVKSVFKLALFLAFVYFWLIVGFSWASPHPYIGVGMGRANESDNVLSGSMETASFGVNFKRLGISVGILNITQQVTLRTLSQGTLSISPLMLSGYFRIPVTRRMRLNMGGGISYVFADYALDSAITEGAGRYGIRIKDDMRNGWGTQAVGGLEYFVTKGFSISADVIYLFFDTEVRRKMTGIPTKSFSHRGQDQSETVTPINLDTLFIGMTAKVHF